jgi:hypothetical protein
MAFIIILATLYVFLSNGFMWAFLCSKTLFNWAVDDYEKCKKALASYDKKPTWFQSLKGHFWFIVAVLLLWCVPVVGGILSITHALSVICMRRYAKKKEPYFKQLVIEKMEEFERKQCLEDSGISEDEYHDFIKAIAAAPEPDSPENIEKFNAIVIAHLADK